MSNYSFKIYLPVRGRLKFHLYPMWLHLFPGLPLLASYFYARFILLSESVSLYKTSLVLSWMDWGSSQANYESWQPVLPLKGLAFSRTSGMIRLLILVPVLDVWILVCILDALCRMERWCASRCPALLCPASIHPSSMDSAVPSVSVSSVCDSDLVWKMCAKTTKFHKAILTIYVCVKMMKMAGPCGLSGPTVRSPVDVEGNRGADPAMASCRPALARQSKPAAACWRSVTARVGHHSVCLLRHMSWFNFPGELTKYSSKSKASHEWI